MDPNLIYVKTASGEEAIQQRTRVIQRNVRMVLILVDGQSSVADLTLKTGNPQLTENALNELEKGGFIELKIEQHDSLWEESKRVAQEIRSAAIKKATQFSSPQSGGQYPDFNQSKPPARSFDDSKSPVSDIPISLHSVFDAKENDDFSKSPFSFASIEPEEIPEFKHASAPKEKEKPKRSRKDKREKKAASVSKPSFVGQLKTIWSRAEHDLDEEPVKLKKIRRQPRSRLGWPVVLFLCLVGIVGLLGVTLFLFPFNIYLPDAEAALSGVIGRPAKITTVNVDIFPTPGVALRGVRIGKENEAIRISEVRFQPDLMTLLSPQKEIKKVVLRGIELDLQKFTWMTDVFSALASHQQTVKIGQILLENTDVSLDSLSLKNMEAKAELNKAGALHALDMRSSDRGLNIVITPVDHHLDLKIEAYAWTPVEGSKFLFDSASLKGKIEDGKLALNTIELHVFDGVIYGSAIIPFGGRASISGEIAFERINSIRLGDALGIGKKFGGEAAGKLRFSMTSNAWSTIFASASGEGDFIVQRGSITGIDLAEAVRRTAGGAVQGGTTSFEQLSGKMKLAPEKKQFFGLQLHSGLMQSTGHVEIGKESKLSGRLELQMKGSVNQTRVPVVIGGTIESPSIQAGRGG